MSQEQSQNLFETQIVMNQKILSLKISKKSKFINIDVGYNNSQNYKYNLKQTIEQIKENNQITQFDNDQKSFEYILNLIKEPKNKKYCSEEGNKLTLKISSDSGGMKFELDKIKTNRIEELKEEMYESGNDTQEIFDDGNALIVGGGFVFAEYNITKDNLYKPVKILNRNKSINNELDNEISALSCDLYLNKRKINFEHQFDKENKYRTKIILKNNLLKNMSYMFSDCSCLISLDLSNLKTENVKDMNHMFSNCSSLISLDLSNFNTNNVQN